MVRGACPSGSPRVLMPCSEQSNPKSGTVVLLKAEDGDVGEGRSSATPVSKIVPPFLAPGVRTFMRGGGRGVVREVSSNHDYSTESFLLASAAAGVF